MNRDWIFNYMEPLLVVTTAASASKVPNNNARRRIARKENKILSIERVGMR